MSRLLRRLAAAPFRRLPLELRDGAAASASVHRAIADEHTARVTLYPTSRSVTGAPQMPPTKGTKR